jgi:hypothetical protein
MCDALQPDVIWKDLKFDKLRESNLVKADFFSLLCDAREGKANLLGDRFDIIIGNPPFESRLSPEGEQIDQTTQKRYKSRGLLPDKQSAYLFLEQSSNLLRSEGLVCLIQPSAFLYKSGVRNFRTFIFQTFEIDTILDFTSIRSLYDAADPKTIAILLHACKPTLGHSIKHWAFRRTASVHERICFEIDHYDQHRVSQHQAETDFYIWRLNLLGGGRLIDMSIRIREARTIEQYTRDQSWDYGEGFIVGGQKVKRKPSVFLTGKPSLPTDAFDNDEIEKSKIAIVKDTAFKSEYKPSRYMPPLVLIKESDSLPIYFWDEGFIAYRAKIIGIPAPRSQIIELKQFYQFVMNNKEKYQFCCTIHGTQALTDKATVPCKQDIDALPYPEDANDLSFSFWEEALCQDTLQYITEYIRLGQNSTLLSQKALSSDLQTYSEMFVRLLKSVYDNLHAAAPIFLDGLTCQPFYFGKHPDFSWLTEKNEIALRQLIYADDLNRHLRTVRLLRFYSSNYLLLIKPDRLRYWIRSTAIRDADETIINLKDQGY